MMKLHRWLRAAVLSFFAILVVAIAVIALAWRERPPVSELGWPVTKSAGKADGQVTVTWLGITTLLFDDGETQILTDGTFSRLGVLDIAAQRRVYSDVATINYALARYHVNRLAAIVPLHSHFDHAMDIGLVANRTKAVILGSESAANIARGAHVPVSQYQILADGESRQFGNFTITLIASRHAPIGIGDEPWFPGLIDEPLKQPARVSDWKAGVSWSVLVEHPQGTALVQGSAGFIKNGLPENCADVAFLSIAGLSGLGLEYTRQYWYELAVRSGASTVYPIHFDDYTKPFGTLELFPYIVDHVVRAAGWIDELAVAGSRPIAISRLPLGEPVVLYHKPP